MLEIMRIRARAYNRSFVFLLSQVSHEPRNKLYFKENQRFENTAYFIFKTSSKNNTLFWEKRHVVLVKTTRCFSENDTLFLGKRHIVLRKTIRCFGENDGLFGRNYGGIDEGLSNNSFIGLFFRGLCNHCDTCDSKKAKTPVMRARTRVGENS